ncbi:outer membrane lipoprotein carrier protein LolA [Amycolatopsis sp. cg5]|uniref:LolA family protein n=1 Tax=Amycolatopsis sp. cg5 TaxID=3238802 RepID=UPI0035250D13
MKPKTKALTAAVVGTALGAAGLAFIAMPASAGDAPTLPAVSADDLVQSVLTAKQPAFDGTVKVSDNLGLPLLNAVPGAGSLKFDEARLFNSGTGSTKLSIKQGNTEETTVNDGKTVWHYSSKTNSASKMVFPDEPGKVRDKAATDPTAATADLLGKVRESSTVAVDGTARVADRPAYELVLTPKPTEKTLLREIRVAVDSETRLPLRVSVLANGSADPVLQIAFSDIEFTAQPAELFQFTPPKDAKVTEEQPKVDDKTLAQAKEAGKDFKVVGDGWDTAITGKFSPDLLKPQQLKSKDGKSVDPKGILAKLGKPVSGTWGSGVLITTKVGTALVTDDGRFAAGAVPEQVLYEALAAK